MFTFDDTPDKVTPVPAEMPASALSVNTADLNKESLELINQIIAESDISKSKDLTYLFNINQNKKTIVRVNKLNELLDAIVNQATTRFTSRPDEISNADLMTSLKVVQDIIERSTKQVNGVTEAPLIQINQQNNEVNVNSKSVNNLGRDSRERVKNAVLSLLNGLSARQIPSVENQTNLEPEDFEPDNSEPIVDNIEEEDADDL